MIATFFGRGITVLSVAPSMEKIEYFQKRGLETVRFWGTTRQGCVAPPFLGEGTSEIVEHRSKFMHVSGI